MMANSARDPYWQAAMRREVTDHPQAMQAIEDKCSTCHMPMDRFQRNARGAQGEVFSHFPIDKEGDTSQALAADGVSCTICHQITDEGFGTEESFTGGYVVDTTTSLGNRTILGPHAVDKGRTRIMQSASEFVPVMATHVQKAEFCAACHTLYTHALGPDGEVLGELPEQVPYLEWRHSAYRDTQSCQDCHMKDVDGEMPISSVLGEPRAGFSRHSFRGGNFFVARMFNRYRDELGVEALEQELDSAAQQTLKHLQSEAARLTVVEAKVVGERLEATLELENLAGHKLPTAYPSRRVWLRIVVNDSGGNTIFESGGFSQDGSIEGNDNDSDPRRFEPHYQEIDNPEQVQIYEVMMADANGALTTGLLTGAKFVKDNRVLPLGFDKTTAIEDIAPRGKVEEDPDFVGAKDRIRYLIDVKGAKGPFDLKVEAWYQPISYRWAQNLRSVDSFETKRFVSYYDSMAGFSATILARESAKVR
jgi:hypothetical protein